MELVCSYCSIAFGSEAELNSHCNSEGHQLIIMSDEGRDWKFRAPPRGVGADQYSLCGTFGRMGKCGLRSQCCDAHGEEELSEWKERYEYRQMKLQRAKECSLQGRHYTEELLEKWMTASNPNLVMAESVDGVTVSVEPETSLTVTEKKCCREWTFHLCGKVVLRRLALLYETHRNHFKISCLKFSQASDLKECDVGASCQEWSSDDVPADSCDCIIKVTFETDIYGTFRQDVVFDFGVGPVLLRKLCVDVVSASDMEKLQQARDTVISFTERWSNEDVTVIPFENRPYAAGPLEKSLLACYPAPTGRKFNLTQSVMEPTMTESNYSARQHELLSIEEMAQYDLLSRYNVRATLNLSSCYLLTPNSAITAKYAHNGELFANMKLSSVLSEDSASGRLVLTNCNTVLLAPTSTHGDEKRQVYEAVIEDKGKTVIYIRLSKQCTEELHLKNGSKFYAEVQFQLNRLPLCEMHFAVDRLQPPSLVFPDVSVQPKLWNAKNNQNMTFEAELNPKQKEAVLAITTPLSQKLPPVLIIGPFGTGKTYTLAQAVKAILREPNTRILVCTHSNSAADIYIREYLYPCVMEGRNECTPLRIYYRHRWVATVHPIVQQYCLVNYENTDRCFKMPTIEDVRARRVIVTTLSTSRYLVQLGLEKGFFTHILIDEAAQAMECEAIMPLSLASETTRIVLAGDHMQLSPEVYSEFAQERSLHTSLLERLYDLYPEDFGCRVLLCENYRSHSAIVSYTSELFYDSHLRAGGQQPPHPTYHPLTFFTARGEDIQDINSTAFHNYAEVFEIVERVIELKNNWPKGWGAQDETSIGVVTPYYDQVVRIRAELRKKKLHGVSVERVLNVQGKQFRVIILSTVRTRQTCEFKLKSGSSFDHGFLSNAKLLNTAITRAQSLVAVVGDPVSLCSVGKCRKLWEKFIFTCHNEKSLFGITWDSLRSQLDSMELKKNFILNPLAPEFVPGRLYHGMPSSSTANEGFFPSVPPPQPLLFFSMPGPPLIQHTITMSAPIHPYINNVNCVIPSMIPPSHPFHPMGMAGTSNIPPSARPSNPVPPRMPLTFPRKTIPSQVKEFENGMGRPLKRSDCATVKDLAEPEEMKRMIYNHVDQTEGYTQPVESETFQNYQGIYGFDEKMRKMPAQIKLDELPNGIMKNGIINNEQKVNMFADRLQHVRNQPQVDDIWNSPLAAQKYQELDSKLHHELDGMNSFGSNEENMRTPLEFNRVPERFQFDNHPQSMFMPIFTEKNNINEQPPNINQNDVPMHNLPVVQTSLLEKLSLLQKILPTGTDIPAFLENEDHLKGFLQLLLASEGTNAAKAFSLLIGGIKKDQQLLQEVYTNFQKKMASSRQFSPLRSIPDSSLRNMHNFNSRSVLSNSHPQDSHVASEHLNIHSTSSFPPSRGFPIDKFDPTPFINSNQNRMDMPKLQSQNTWLMENGINNRHAPEPPTFDMSKISIRNPLENKMPNMDRGIEMFPAYFSNIQQNRGRVDFERPDESLRHMWSTPEIKAFEPAGTPFQFSEPGRQGSYLSKLRNISNVVNGGTTNGEIQLDFPVGEKPLPRSSVSDSTPGPLSMSYPDVPNILSRMSLGNSDPSPKVIRKPISRSSESSAMSGSPFVFDMSGLQSNESPLRYQQLSSEGMTYAKILRSPQQ